jgi:CD20-like family
MEAENKEEIEAAVVPAELQALPPSKPASLFSGSGDPDSEKKYETIQPTKTNEYSAKINRNHEKTLEKPKIMMNSSLNLLSAPEVEMLKPRSCISVNTKLGIIQLVLSILLSAFGGLLIARNASLSMFGSGIWSGIFAGIAGSLGLMNIKPLLNGFLACSLVCVATSTLALALTGIGLVRDYNITQQDPVSLHTSEMIIYAVCIIVSLLML